MPFHPVGRCAVTRFAGDTIGTQGSLLSGSLSRTVAVDAQALPRDPLDLHRLGDFLAFFASVYPRDRLVMRGLFPDASGVLVALDALYGSDHFCGIETWTGG